MDSTSERNRCSVCQKSEVKCICYGCKTHFCIRHFNEHRQGLSIKFDDEVVRSHDELLEKINAACKMNTSSPELVDEIDVWEMVTLDMVRKAAEQARYKLVQILNQQKQILMQEYGMMSKEIGARRKEDEFDENDIVKFRQKMNQIQISLTEILQPKRSKMILVKSDPLDWNRLIYVEKNDNRISK